ncbi:MAG: hypothetical protein MUO40_08680 [Anaerolineaceae bacterium]|nr:hypothetical protein [Anaerolineaceae bacterium]
MKNKVVVPITAGMDLEGRQTIPIVFPQRCVFCCGRCETYTIVDVSGGKSVGKRSTTFSTRMNLPYCLEHADIFSRYKKLLSSFGIPIFILVFVGWFFLMMPFGDMITANVMPGIDMIFIPLMFPCIGNLIMAFLAISILHYLLILSNRNFRQVPFITQHGGLGVEIKLNTTMYSIEDVIFKFSNHEYASEFATLNGVSFWSK